MESNIGKKYLTRNKKVATHMGYWRSGWHLDNDLGKTPLDVSYPVVMLIEGKRELYSIDGRFISDAVKSPWDIIREYKPKRKVNN